MNDAIDTRITRRGLLKAGGTFAGYALSADTVLAQAVKTDTSGIAAAQDAWKRCVAWFTQHLRA